MQLVSQFTIAGRCIYWFIHSLQLLVDEQTSHTHASTNAHARQQNLGFPPPAFAQTRHDLACTGSAEWMSQGNGTACAVCQYKLNCSR